jgi:regulator of protease activity HflC (stomatin/prohibitin superfamily)
MENILGLIGTITGVLGLLISVLLVRWQAKVHAKELEMERAEREKERALLEAEKEKERALLEAEKEKERAFFEERIKMEQARNERSERLTFLADRIFDISIPRDLRLPFYEEYISMKGNGTAVRFWLAEESRAAAIK